MMMMMMMVVWWLLTNYMKKCPAHLQWTTVGSALGFIFCLNSRTNLWMITINPWLSLDAHWLSPNQCVRKLWNALVRPVGEMKLGKKTLTSFPIIHLLNPKLPKKHIFHVLTLFWALGKPKIALLFLKSLKKPDRQIDILLLFKNLDLRVTSTNVNEMRWHLDVPIDDWSGVNRPIVRALLLPHLHQVGHHHHRSEQSRCYQWRIWATGSLRIRLPDHSPEVILGWIQWTLSLSLNIARGTTDPWVETVAGGTL